MATITDQMITVYCFVDDFLRAHPRLAGWRTSNNAHPAFSDAEVITIALMQGSFGCATLKQTHRLVQQNWPFLFPRLPSYPQWLSRLHQLTGLVGRLIQQVKRPLWQPLSLIDSKPIPICKPIRHGRVRLLREEGAYWGKSKAGWYFGFKLHVLADPGGSLLCAFLTPANWDDRDVALALAEAGEGSILLGDLGYRDAQELEPRLWEEYATVLVTPAHAAGAQRALISSVRERIETCFSSLWSRFVDRVLSRSWTGLWNTIKLKMLHYNLCQAGILSV